MPAPITAAHPARLAILTRHFSKSAGGAENYAVQLALHLAAQFPEDYDIHVFSHIIWN
jgi:hypothetical protein